MWESPDLTMQRPARDREAEYASGFSVGGVSVRIASDDRAAVCLVPSLLPFQDTNEVADINIRVEPIAELRRARASKVFDSGSVWRLFDDECGFRFDFTSPMLGDSPYKRLFVNSEFSRATLQTSKEVFQDFPGVAPLDYPLDELLIMHRLTQERAIELHGCGIAHPDGRGNLFVGHSGAGKSTMTRLWTAQEDVEVLSDDRIIVRRDERQQVPHRRFAPVRNDKRYEMRMYGTPWHGEGMYASPNNAPLGRIFILEHGRGNVLTPLSPSQAVAELFARSFVPFHRHEYVDSALTFLQKVAATVPVYRYAFEPDQRAVDTILNLRD
jgi:hypothetical protein